MALRLRTRTPISVTRRVVSMRSRSPLSCSITYWKSPPYGTSAPTRARPVYDQRHTVKGSTGSRSGAQAKPSTERVRIEGRRPALDRLTKDKLRAKPGEVKAQRQLPRGMPSGERLPFPSVAWEPTCVQRARRFKPRTTRGEAATGSAKQIGVRATIQTPNHMKG